MEATSLKALSRWLRSALQWIVARPTLAILLLFLSHAATIAAVLSVDRAPLWWDESRFFSMSLKYLETMRRGDAAGLISSMRGAWPPMHQLLSLPIYALFGASPDVAVLSTLPALLVLLISVYHIGKELHSTDAGLLAAALTGFLPGIAVFSRMYMQDYTLASMVALSLALMLKTRGFSRRSYTFAFGISIGTGLLTRWTYTPFVLGPLLLYTYGSYRDILTASKWPRTECMQRGKWLAISVLCGLLIASAWYLPNLEAVFSRFRVMYRFLNNFHDFETDIRGLYRFRWGRFSVLNLSYYLRALYVAQLRPMFSFVALGSLAHLLKVRRRDAAWLVSWLLVPLLLFTVAIRQKSITYVIPYLPAVALIIAIGSMTSRQGQRRIFVALLLLAGLVQFFALTVLSAPVNPLRRYDFGLPRPDTRDWHAEELTDTLNAALANRTDPFVLLLYSKLYSGTTLEYLQRMGALAQFRMRDVGPCWTEDFNCNNSPGFYEGLLAQSDILMLGEGGYAPVELTYDYDAALMAWESSRPAFTHLKRFEFPDSRYHLDVYARREPASPAKRWDGERIGYYAASEGRGYADKHSRSNVLNTGAEAHLRFSLAEGARPRELVLQYSAYRPEGLGNPHFSVLIEGILAANVSEEPPYPWTILGVPFPEGLEHNGTLDVRILSDTYVDESGEERGIALDWLTILCEGISGCLEGWSITIPSPTLEGII